MVQLLGILLAGGWVRNRRADSGSVRGEFPKSALIPVAKMLFKGAFLENDTEQSLLEGTSREFLPHCISRVTVAPAFSWFS